MIKDIFLWRRVLMLTAVFAVAVVISAFAGAAVVSDTVLFPLADVRSAVSFNDAVVYSLAHCTSSAFQMVLLFASSFSLLSKVCASAVLLYRGVCIGYAASLISSGAVMASAGGVMSFRTVLPVLALYLASSILMIAFSAISASDKFSLARLTSKKRCLSLCAIFAVISGAVFLIDIVKIWLI